MRSTREVLESHLAYRSAGDLEADLARNYADDVVLLSWGEGVRHGKDGVRRLAGILGCYVEAGTYTYDRLVVDDAYGMLHWRAQDGRTHVRAGADSYVVRDGVIVAQTIAYAVDRAG
ncbi:nuclear transport factor 2 family protein [Cellulomonas sp. IC4_254]|uniref:nuclear transport factor 2 family protein n=1 Tax=Cellulomonas sp. IC4_254 TaxID=2714040 RepID=UPI00141E9606|nr:nuclear transport factor 2 family protein [Cellulomonas sp. IC4_254]NHT16672.1 nuclear transport factor 2 family protein [Cellulomonas sp. IC4_254]